MLKLDALTLSLFIFFFLQIDSFVLSKERQVSERHNVGIRTNACAVIVDAIVLYCDGFLPRLFNGFGGMCRFDTFLFARYWPF